MTDRTPPTQGPRYDQDPGNLAMGPDRTMILTEYPRRIVPTVYNTQPWPTHDEGSLLNEIITALNEAGYADYGNSLQQKISMNGEPDNVRFEMNEWITAALHVMTISSTRPTNDIQLIEAITKIHKLQELMIQSTIPVGPSGAPVSWTAVEHMVDKLTKI